MLAALGMTDIHAMNKLKVILGAVINGVAAWRRSLRDLSLAAGGSDDCGRGGGRLRSVHYAQKVCHRRGNGLVIAIGAGL